MNIKRSAAGLFLALIATSLSPRADHARYSLASLLDLSPNKSVKPVKESFHGLALSIDGETTSCQRKGDDRMLCHLATKGSTDTSIARAVLTLKKTTVKSRRSQALLRLRFKERLKKKFASLNQYLELPHRVGTIDTIVQQARYFRYDNINWPVLIRSFDVVLNENTIVSAKMVCDMQHWPLIQEITGKIEQSMRVPTN